MPWLLRLLSVLAACLMTASCASSPMPLPALPRPLPAALLQPCPAPPAPASGKADEVATVLMQVYGLYGQCAGLHGELVRELERPGKE